MKKILAIAMAIVMMMAIAVPAFATEGTVVDQVGTADTTTVIKTSTDKADGTDGAYYIVTIPADTTIAWGKTEAEVLTYSVESHLKYGERLSVSVSGNGVMTFEPDLNKVLELAYTLGGDIAFTADKEVINPAVDKAITVTVAEDDWKNAIVGEYADTLTFTASVA